jgi:hypothetical protein
VCAASKCPHPNKQDSSPTGSTNSCEWKQRTLQHVPSEPPSAAFQPASHINGIQCKCCISNDDSAMLPIRTSSQINLQRKHQWPVSQSETVEEKNSLVPTQQGQAGRLVLHIFTAGASTVCPKPCHALPQCLQELPIQHTWLLYIQG